MWINIKGENYNFSNSTSWRITGLTLTIFYVYSRHMGQEDIRFKSEKEIRKVKEALNRLLDVKTI